MKIKQIKTQNGFSLIELMIVIAIIGILATIAFPAYQDYIIRSQVIEGPLLSNELKIRLKEDFGTKGSWPANNTEVGIGIVSGNYVSSVISENGVVKVIYGNKANTAQLSGKILTIRPAVNQNGDVVWVCGTSTAPAGHNLVGVDATNIQGKHLSSACRS